jgi:hypothetical protein
MKRGVATRISGASQLDPKVAGQLLAGSIDLGVVVVTEQTIEGIGRSLSVAEIVGAAFEAAQAVAVSA